MKEELKIVEDVLDPERSYAVYSQSNGGFAKSWGLAIEPRDTLLQRARLMAAEVESVVQ